MTPTNFNYDINGNNLEEVASIKYLGVTLHEKLSWHEHINDMSNKANKSLFFIRRNFGNSSVETRNLLYNALVRSRLEYACSAWDPFKLNEIGVLDNIQRRGARLPLVNLGGP